MENLGAGENLPRKHEEVARALLDRGDTASWHYFLADASYEATPDADADTRERRWAARIRELERFTAAHGRWPRDKARDQPRTDETRLADWVRSERKKFAREGVDDAWGPSGVEYARYRLARIPGFRRSPVDDQWATTWTAWKDFVGQDSTCARLPRRDAGGAEAKLASWADHQRRLHRAQALRPDRLVQLRDFHIRLLPPDATHGRG